MPEELVQAAANEAETAAPQNAQESTGTTQSAESTTKTETNSVKTDTRAVSNRINQIRAESDRKIKELTDQLARYRKLEDTAKELGFNGTSTDEIVYAMMADKEGLTVDEIRKREEAKNQQVDSIVENDPRIAAANEIIQQSKFRADLESIKAAYPDLKAESVEDLGEDYIKMQIVNEQQPEEYQLDAATIYGMAMAKKAKTEKKIPASTGDVESGAAPEKEFYTSQEVDHFTKEDYLKDPSLLEKVRKSMTKWRN